MNNPIQISSYDTPIMANCCKIIRLLKEVKRKADTSFCEINEKITKLESKYNLLSQQNEHLKKQVEESKMMLHPAEAGGGVINPPVAPATVARRKRFGRRRLRNKSKVKSRSASRRSSRVGRRRSARRPVTAARRIKKRGRKQSAKGRKGRFRRRNPCL